MSKKNSTKNLILDHAVKLFNERGIEYVGVREIANDLNLHVGNVTYYYPTKDDIVVAIANQLADLNSKTIRPIEGLTLLGFLNNYKKAFENHYQYRCLFISFVQQFEQNKKLESSYLKTQKTRVETLRQNMAELIENRYLDQKTTADQIDFILSAISLIARFWISESRVSYKHLNKKQLFKHYLELIVNILQPFATKSGEKDIAAFRKSI